MTTKPTPKRTKTPRQRAEEAVAAADRKVKRLAAQDRKARDHATAIAAELDDARIRLAYLKQDPALKPPSPSGEPAA